MRACMYPREGPHTHISGGAHTQVAKSIGYMVNANSTFGGGCPVPPPPKADLQRFGEAFAAAILAADDQEELWGASLAATAKRLDTPNVTAASLAGIKGTTVADTLLGALFVAGRTCGPPNALTSSLQASVIAKYLNGGTPCPWDLLAQPVALVKAHGDCPGC